MYLLLLLVCITCFVVVGLLHDFMLCYINMSVRLYLESLTVFTVIVVSLLHDNMITWYDMV